MKTITLTSLSRTGWCLALLASGSLCLGGVKNAAWLQGNLLDNGTSNLAAPPAAPLTILWNQTSSIDGTVFDHSFSDPASLRVLKDGDYFFAFTAPVRLSGTPQRATSIFQVYVNGSPVPGALGQSTMIRNAPQHKQSSGHFSVLVPGLQADDVVEIKTYRTAVVTGDTELEKASLFVERVDDSVDVFSATATETIGGPDLNLVDGTANTQLAWFSNRKDSGYAHTDGSHQVSLDAGRYLVYVNVPMASAVQRASAGIRVTLDDVQVKNGLAEQGYIRNGSPHTESSVHWSGLVTVNGSQNLAIQTLQRAEVGVVTVPAGKPATLTVVKVDNPSGLFTSALYDEFFDFNLVAPTPLKWNDPAEVLDAATYAHASGQSDIRVTQDGSYYVVYNDDLEGGSARANPIIKILVNGQPVPGAEVKTHYIRQTSNHVYSSGTMSFLLENLKANDLISLTTQREEVDGTVFGLLGDALAIVTIIKKEDFVPTVEDGLAPRVRSFSGNLFGFDIELTDQSTSVDGASISVTLNDEPVSVATSKDGKITRIRFDDETFPATGTVQNVVVSYSDSAGSEFAVSLSYTVKEAFTRADPLFAVDGVNLNEPGFRVRVTQISTFTGTAGAHGNNISGAETQLSGINPQTNEPFVNEANPENHLIDTVINWEQAGADVGGENFGSGNGFGNGFIPGIPGTTGSTDGLVTEILTYLELEPGFHTLGVNSDDGFQMTMGRSPRDLLGSVLGFWNAGRGATDTLFNLVVDQAGFYPVRLIWFEGNGGANVEFFSVKNGEKILVNDRSNPNAIKAYRTGPLLPYVSAISSPNGTFGSLVEIEITEGTTGVADGSVGISIDGKDVTPAITRSGSVLNISFDNGEPFIGGDHVVVFRFSENSNPPVERTAEVTFRTPLGVREFYQDSPVAYWALGETEGTTAFSEVNVNIHGTYTSSNGLGLPELGVERVAVGSPSYAARFNKDNQNLIKVPDHPDLNNGGPWEERTIEIWFKAGRLPRAVDGVLGAGYPERQILFEEGGATRGICIYLYGNQTDENPTEAELWFLAWNRAEEIWGNIPDPTLDPNNVPVAVKTTIQAGTDYQAVFVMDGDPVDFNGSLSGFLNGQHLDTVTGVHLLYSHTADIGIGAMFTDAGFHDRLVDATFTPGLAAELFWFDGVLDDVVVYPTALSAERIQAHFVAGTTEVPFGGNNGTVGQFTGIRVVDGQVEITWEGDGQLQCASEVGGGYEDVADAVSPYRAVLIPGENRFYRLRK